MAKISISEAARLAGISRSALYRGYISKGKLTVERDKNNAPMVDTPELFRVFGETAKRTGEQGIDQNIRTGVLMGRSGQTPGLGRGLRKAVAGRQGARGLAAAQNRPVAATGDFWTGNQAQVVVLVTIKAKPRPLLTGGAPFSGWNPPRLRVGFHRNSRASRLDRNCHLLRAALPVSPSPVVPLT
jgi:hypothetical protein